MDAPPKQRYLQHVRHLNTRFGNTILNPANKFYYPSTNQMNKFDQHYIPYDIDPALRKAIIKLNERGYSTYTSCQGHTKGKEGWITIVPDKSEVPNTYWQGRRLKASKKPVNPIEVKHILQSVGIRVKKYIHGKPEQDMHMFKFNAIEGFEAMYEYKPKPTEVKKE